VEEDKWVNGIMTCAKVSLENQVVGLDLSRYLLIQAKKRSKEVGAESLQFVCGDMRYLPLRSARANRC